MTRFRPVPTAPPKSARLAALLLACAGALSMPPTFAATPSEAPPVPAAPEPAWVGKLADRLDAIETPGRARFGVHVRDLDTGAQLSARGERRWYLASMVKVPVAITVLRAIERGQFTLDTPLTLRASDLVDGAGTTSHQAVGTPIPVRRLLEQMIIESDNTASDMLIDLVGIAHVNETVRALVPTGFERITTLSEVRRLVYGRLVPHVERLSGQDLLALHAAPNDAERLQLLRRLAGAPEAGRRGTTLDAAYDAFYASDLNSAPLDAYADLLARLVAGQALTPPWTEYLLGLMERVATGTHRIRAGLPPTVRWAHKTGTQRRRVCDAGLLRWPEAGRERRALVVACTRDAPTPERAEALLRQVGNAVCRSGLITNGVVDAPSCPAAAAPAAHGVPALEPVSASGAELPPAALARHPPLPRR